MTAHSESVVHEFAGDEAALIKQLREKIDAWDKSHFEDEFLKKHLYLSDSDLWRYLKARDFNLEQAFEMYRQSLTWKHEVKIDQLMEEFRGDGSIKAAIERATTDRAKRGETIFGGGVLHGVKSQTGAHVIVERLGKVDFAGLSKDPKAVEEYKLAYSVYLEESWQEIRKMGGKHQALMVIDMKGLGVSSLRHVSLVKKIAKIGPQSYPEVMKTVVLVNAPKVVNYFWNFVGPMLPPHTKQKVHIPSKTQVATLLDELIDGGSKQLPTFLGGQHSGESICPAEPVSKAFRKK